MQSANIRTLLLTTFFISTFHQSAFAQQSMTPDSVSMTRTSELSGGPQIADQTVVFDINIERAGNYVLTAPVQYVVQVYVDGVLMVTSAANAAGRIADLTAFLSLAAGPHRIELTGADISPEFADMVLLKRVGTSSAIPLSSMSSVPPAIMSSAAILAVKSNEVAAAETGNVGIQSQIISVTREPNNRSASTVEGLRAAQDIRNWINDALDVTGPTPAPPINNGAASSPLSPPAGVVTNEMVEIMSSSDSDDKIAATGQTLFGRVLDPNSYDIVNVVIQPSGRTATVEVGQTFGGFAVRLFEEDLTSGAATVTVSAGSSNNDEVTTVPVTYNYTAATVTDGVGMALSRMTYGATAELYARVRAMGYHAYVAEQLSPESIDDRFFESMNFGRLLERDTNGAHSVATSLQRHNLATATYTRKQLQETMGAFWSNHLHASNKMSGVLTQAMDDRQFYRENAFADFEDLLLYSASSPLMSQFLDNDQSKVGNLNENYGREILELHTVGVDAGYGDEDVIAVSRIFTGWNYRRTNPNSNGLEALYEFEFRAEDHDTEDKYIPFLDITIEGRAGPAGIEEAEELIAILAQHPSTQNFICRKIVQWFVSDTPPANFVDICVNAWEQSGGNSREVVRAILLAPEFITTPEIRRTKGKNPLEYGASVIRAAGAMPADPIDTGIWYWFSYPAKNAGYNPAAFPVPTGLPEFGAAWANTSSFVAEFNAGNIMFANRRNMGILLEDEFADNGLETAEEAAAYLLAIGTNDLYRQDEFDAMVNALKGTDGVFLMDLGLDMALGRAIRLLTVLPSFHLQ